MRVSTIAFVALALTLIASRPSAAAQTRAFTVNTDFATGTLRAIDLDTRTVSGDVAAVGSDPAIRWYNGLLHVVNRFGGDNLQVIDPAQSYATIRNISTGNGSNPQDIAFLSATKAYVSRYGSADLLIMNPSDPSGLPQSSISLAEFADSDGLPEMARMIRVERWLFVACQRLTGFAPSNPSVVVVIDTQADTVLDVDPNTPGKQGIPLTLRNPFTGFAFDRANTRLLLGCSGAFGDLDGGVEAIDPIGLQNLGVLITETQLGGNVSEVVWHSPTKAYASTTFGFPGVGTLVSWNPANGTPYGVIHGPGEFNLPDAEINDRGELYVCRQDFSTPGVLVFDTSNDGLLAGPLSTGLPPVALTFDQATDAVTEVPPQQGRGMATAVWPNPARGATRLSLRLPAAERVHMQVFDASGRRVRLLANEARPAGSNEVYWDLTDTWGHPVPTGLYFIGIRIGKFAFTERVAVIR